MANSPTYFQKNLIRPLLARIALTMTVVAASSCTQAGESYPKVIQGAVDNGVKVVRTFPAASGLTGWVLSEDGRQSIVYTTADKKSLLLGTLIDEDGANLSSRYAEKYIPKQDIGVLFKELEKSTYVAEGQVKDPKSVIYVFVDANCPFCHFTWKALQPYEKVGLQVRWVLVATLGPTSMPKAVEVLAATDKTAAFRKMEENHGKSWAPSAQSAESGKQPITESIRRNGELMEKFGVAGTPGLVWKDKSGKVLVKGGMPRLSEIPAITRLPEQTIDDIELARFR